MELLLLDCQLLWEHCHGKYVKYVLELYYNWTAELYYKILTVAFVLLRNKEHI